ncbi:hypothetical protein B7463_g10870, partial [Scytalidium lignicola]
MLTIKPILNHNLHTNSKPETYSSPFSTPCLAIYTTTNPPSKPLQLHQSLHDSHDILLYLSSTFSTTDGPDHHRRENLYTSCGASKAAEIQALEKRYDEGLGVAARDFWYRDMMVMNKWRSMLPFAFMGFRNRVGVLQSLVWFGLSPLLGRMIVAVLEITEERYRETVEICREEFRHASELLEKSEYLAGNSLSAADITFAAHSSLFLGITHQEGFQQYPLCSYAYSSEAKALQKELRDTKAGQHVLRLFKEERYFGTPLPRRKRSLLGLW